MTVRDTHDHGRKTDFDLSGQSERLVSGGWSARRKVGILRWRWRTQNVDRTDCLQTFAEPARPSGLRIGETTDSDSSAGAGGRWSRAFGLRLRSGAGYGGSAWRFPNRQHHAPDGAKSCARRTSPHWADPGLGARNAGQALRGRPIRVY